MSMSAEDEKQLNQAMRIAHVGGGKPTSELVRELRDLQAMDRKLDQAERIVIVEKPVNKSEPPLDLSAMSDEQRINYWMAQLARAGKYVLNERPPEMNYSDYSECRRRLKKFIKKGLKGKPIQKEERR